MGPILILKVFECPLILTVYSKQEKSTWQHKYVQVCIGIMVIISFDGYNPPSP